MVDELLQKKPDMRPDLHQIFKMQAMKDKMALLGYNLQPGAQDEKDSVEESLANLNLQPGAQDQSHEDLADLVGGDIEELDYRGNKKPKNFKLSWLKKAFKIKELWLLYNEIVTIEKLNHLKELKELNLAWNKI